MCPFARLFLLTTLAAAPLAPCATANDECRDAVLLPLGRSYLTAVGSLSSPAWPCGSIQADLWYYLDAPGNGTFTLTGENLSLATELRLEAFRGGCSALSSVACGPTVGVEVRYGERLYLRAGWNSVFAIFQIVAEFTARGDECSDAFRLLPGTNGPFDTHGATTTTSSSLQHLREDLWFRYTPLCDSITTFSLCGGVLFDSVIALYEEVPGSSNCSYRLRLLASNDNEPSCPTNPLASELTLPLVADTSYYLQVGSGILLPRPFEFRIEVSGVVGPNFSIATLHTGCGADLDLAAAPLQSLDLRFTLTNAAGRPSILWLGSRTGTAVCGTCTLGAEFGVVFPFPSLDLRIPCDPTLRGGTLCFQGAVLDPGSCAGIAFSQTHCITFGSP